MGGAGRRGGGLGLRVCSWTAGPGGKFEGHGPSPEPPPQFSVLYEFSGLTEKPPHDLCLQLSGCFLSWPLCSSSPFTSAVNPGSKSSAGGGTDSPAPRGLARRKPQVVLSPVTACPGKPGWLGGPYSTHRLRCLLQPRSEGPSP